jgi:chemotaxis protein CheD
MSRFWEPKLGKWMNQLLPGDLLVTDQDEVLSTVLGSCIAACVREPSIPVGGMNHFMLPMAPRGGDEGASARYGLYALECLVNEILRRGGLRSRLEVKVFGGGRVLDGGTDIGKGNIDFVRGFFLAENIPILVEDVGDRIARRLRYWPLTGRVQVLHMPMDKKVKQVLEQESRAAVKLPSAGSVELF